MRNFESIKNEELGADVIDGLEQKERIELLEILSVRQDKEKIKREIIEKDTEEDVYPISTDDKTEIELVNIKNLTDEELILFKRLLELDKESTIKNDIDEYDMALNDYHKELEKTYLKDERAKKGYNALKDPRENFYAWLKNNLSKVQLDEFYRNNRAA